MGMYCCCGVKISGFNYEGKPTCCCSWDGWISTCDWPKERRNKDIPCSLPNKDGKYLVRIQNSNGDRYEDIKQFFLNPKIEKENYFGQTVSHELHWEDETGEEGTPYAWKELELMNKWISVKDKLPLPLTPVLAYDGMIYIAMMPDEKEYNEHWKICKDRDCPCIVGCTGAITHWMPLPKPPKEEN